MSNAVEYTGHGENTGGLQGHSVGDDYPYCVLVTQNYGDKSLADRGGVEVPNDYWVMDTRTGNRVGPYPTAQRAFIEIASLKVRNMMHG